MTRAGRRVRTARSTTPLHGVVPRNFAHPRQPRCRTAVPLAGLAFHHALRWSRRTSCAQPASFPRGAWPAGVNRMHSRSSYRLRAPARRTSHLHSCLPAPRKSAKFGKFEVRRLLPTLRRLANHPWNVPPRCSTAAVEKCRDTGTQGPLVKVKKRLPAGAMTVSAMIRQASEFATETRAVSHGRYGACKTHNRRSG